ncbi:hypothetical protein [Namhaeicola litoreus]|uniref:Uncharacterized protein n=1 Tax=Namhaeicola litoreus TaxID=1052145 RepID=A0ABW3Y4K2_9FLAO
MIIDILLGIEEKIKSAIIKDELALDAIRSLLKIFEQIDFNSELIVVKDLVRLKNLAESLKGEVLSEKEKEMLAQVLVRHNQVME